MSIPYQNTFTQTESVAIVDMVAKLASDDYGVLFWLGATEKTEDGKYFPWRVQIVENADDSIVADSSGYKMVDALSDAYQRTPEGKAALAAAGGE